MKMCRDKQKDLHIMFMDLEKRTYDKIPQEIIWRVSIWIAYIQVIIGMYHEAEKCVWTCEGDIETFQKWGYIKDLY